MAGRSCLGARRQGDIRCPAVAAIEEGAPDESRTSCKAEATERIRTHHESIAQREG